MANGETDSKASGDIRGDSDVAATEVDWISRLSLALRLVFAHALASSRGNPLPSLVLATSLSHQELAQMLPTSLSLGCLFCEMGK